MAGLPENEEHGMILLIDNYDSFVYNLARYLQELGVAVEVLRNDVQSVGDVLERDPDAIVLSPGPCGPAEAGISVELVREALGRIPLLGVCLGHQVLGAATGASIIRAPRPVHGQVTRVRHDAAAMFRGLPNPLRATRYHSLVVDSQTLGDQWDIVGRGEDDLVMAIAHSEHVAWGVQFHPESVLTDSGHRLLWNFLIEAGIATGNMPAISQVAPVSQGQHGAGWFGRDQLTAVFPDPTDDSARVLHW
tara:strand:+ start:436 stop:1179 length:744 start_codon:yes stop_codon:yes gene_type:complete